jgi:hypothetical protein
VTGAGAGTVAVTGTLPGGRLPYRLSGPRPAADVQVTAVTDLGAGLAEVALAADPGLARDALGGGTLTVAGGQQYAIAGNQGASLVVRAAATAPVLPATGSAHARGPAGPRLEGAWMPATDAAGATKLVIGARTPFAQFHNNTTTMTGTVDPGYACGPTPTREPTCLRFADAAPATLGGTPLVIGTVSITGSGDATISAIPKSSQALRLGAKGTGRSLHGTATLTFTGPVDRAWVHGYTEEAGTVTARLGGATVGVQRLARTEKVLVIPGPVDELVIDGTLVVVSEVCFLPDWTCTHFEAASFPQDSTGRQSYAGLELESAGTMRVDNGVLSVRTPAALTVYFPRPVTRVRLAADAAVDVSVAAGATVLASGMAAPGNELELDAGDGWLDRVTVGAPAGATIQVREICTDAGDFGWQRYQQWTWQDSVRRSLSAFTSSAPVLAPGSYRLDVVSGWVDEAQPGAATTWSTTSASFQVGGPPGLRTGATGPLNDLGTYVQDTMPAAGERPFYRSYDIGVAFSRDYVSRMFLENATPLLLGVVDANQRVLRPGAANVWGRGPDLALTAEETDWLATLHSDGDDPCASIDTSSVSRNEVVYGGAGQLLPAARLCTGRLGTAAASALFAFDFVTSRYVSFAHHMASFGGVRGAVAGGTLDAAALRAGLVGPEQAVATARSALATAVGGVSSGTPTAAQFDALTAARSALEVAKAALDGSRRAAFTQAAAVTGVPRTRPRPTGVEVTAVGGGFLVESDEPVGWDRVTLTLGASSTVPRQAETVSFDERGLGGPDVGDFAYVGRVWTTTAELWAKGGVLSARLADPWTLAFPAESATSVEVVVEVAGTPVVLTGTGAGVSAPATASTPGPATLSVSGTSLASLTLSGAGHAVHAIRFGSLFAPAPAAGPVRLLDAVLPSAPGAGDHYVELLAEEATDLAGWTLQWRPADASADWLTYHVCTPWRSLPAGGIARVVGGAATGGGVAGRATWFGGTVGTVPTTGIVLRLVDAAGTVIHQRAAMPAGTATPYGLVPDEDGTRAYVIPTAPVPTTPTWWTMSLSFARDLGPGEPLLSVAGNTSRETASLAFATPPE